MCLFQRHGARIIIGNFYENKARVIFCEAYKQGMFGAKYVWIITGKMAGLCDRSKIFNDNLLEVCVHFYFICMFMNIAVI